LAISLSYITPATRHPTGSPLPLHAPPTHTPPSNCRFAFRVVLGARSCAPRCVVDGGGVDAKHTIGLTAHQLCEPTPGGVWLGSGQRSVDPPRWRWSEPVRRSLDHAERPTRWVHAASRRVRRKFVKRVTQPPPVSSSRPCPAQVWRCSPLESPLFEGWPVVLVSLMPPLNPAAGGAAHQRLSCLPHPSAHG
jgi:hypothetical protein